MFTLRVTDEQIVSWYKAWRTRSDHLRPLSLAAEQELHRRGTPAKVALATYVNLDIPYTTLGPYYYHLVVRQSERSDYLSFLKFVDKAAEDYAQGKPVRLPRKRVFHFRAEQA